MARPLARDGNESNRIGSSMLKRCARNIARPGRDLLCPSTTWNEKDDARNCDIQNWSLRNTYTYNIIYIYTSFHITQTPKKKETSYHTLYFVGSWSEKFYQKKPWPASDLPERKKKTSKSRDPPSRCRFLSPGRFPGFSRVFGLRPWWLSLLRTNNLWGHKIDGCPRWSVEKMEV